MGTLLEGKGLSQLHMPESSSRQDYEVGSGRWWEIFPVCQSSTGYVKEPSHLIPVASPRPSPGTHAFFAQSGLK